MSDDFDRRSIIVIAKHDSRVVGSMRLIISEGHQKFEHEHSLVIPKHFPKKEDTIEITRVCTHPDYRAGDLLEGLFQYCAYVSMSHGRNWIIGSSTDDLLPMYKRLGFKTVPIFFTHQDFTGQKHTLFIANKNDIIVGKSVSPVVWSVMYEDIYKFAKNTGLLRATLPIDKLRLTLYRSLGHLARFIRIHLKNRSYEKFNMNET